MQGLRIFQLLVVFLLAVNVTPADALDMKDTRGRPTPNLADEWDSHWAAVAADTMARYARVPPEPAWTVGFVLVVGLIIGILVLLAVKFRIWAMHSTLVNLNTLGNGWLLWWAARWGAY